MKLIVKDLKKKFDKKEILKGINFEFEQGKIYGLLRKKWRTGKRHFLIA